MEMRGLNVYSAHSLLHFHNGKCWTSRRYVFSKHMDCGWSGPAIFCSHQVWGRSPWQWSMFLCHWFLEGTETVVVPAKDEVARPSWTSWNLGASQTQCEMQLWICEQIAWSKGAEYLQALSFCNKSLRITIEPQVTIYRMDPQSTLLNIVRMVSRNYKLQWKFKTIMQNNIGWSMVSVHLLDVYEGSRCGKILVVRKYCYKEKKWWEDRLCYGFK